MKKESIRVRAANPHDTITREYGRVIEDNPGNIGAFYNRGCAYKYKGELEKANRDFNSVIKLDPMHSRAYNRVRLTFTTFTSRMGSSKEQLEIT